MREQHMRSRVASFALMLLLAIGALCGVGASRAYAETPTASIGSIDNLSVETGGTIVVPINLSGNPGIMGMGLTVDYDADALTPVSVEATSLTSEGTYDDSIETSGPGSFKIQWAHSENVTGDGTLFNVTFNVSGYAEGPTSITLGYSQKDTFNEDFDDVVLACSPISIEVMSKSVTSTTIRGGANLSVTDGNQIDVPILIDNIDGVSALSFDLAYDSSVFTYKGFTPGIGQTCDVAATENGCNVTVSDIDANSATGTLLTLAFDAAECSGGAFVFSIASDTVAANDFRVKVVNTHADQNAIILGGEVEVSGSELNVPIKITNNHGIAAFRFTMTYDPAVISPVSVVKNGVLSGSINNTIGDKEGSFDVLWTGVDNFTANDVLYTAKFNLLDETVANTKIGMSYTPEDTCDENANDVLLTMKDIDVVFWEIGITSLDFKVDITNCDTYSFGSPLKPTVTVDGLTEGIDYKVSYSDNINAGEGKVIITGLKPYGGTIVKLFTIAPANLLLANPGIKATSVVYSGKAYKPQVTFATSGLAEDKDYKLTYKDNVNIGEASVVVAGLNNYAGSKTLTFKILPSKAVIKTAKSKKAKTIKVVPKKQAGGVKYQVAYRPGKKGAWKHKTIKKKSITLKKLKRGKKYNVRIRAFKKVGAQTYYGAWSKTKKVKVR